MICQSDNGLPNVNVTLQEDMAWLRTTQMAELFRVTVCDYHECKNVLNMVICGTEVPRFER